MTIGIDARFFGPKAKGLGRYTQQLLSELAKLDRQNDYLVFLRAEDFADFQPPGPRFKKVLANYRWYSLGEQLLFPLALYRHKIDLMHFTHFNAPVLYARPYVITIHDLILRRFGTARGWFWGRARYWLKNLGYEAVIRIIVRRAKKIIAVSEYVKQDIIDSFGMAPEKIAVVYESGPAATNYQPAAGDNRVLEKYQIKKPYLLYVGNAYPHKNLERLIESFKILQEKDQPDLQLVLVGGEDYFYRRLKRKNCDAAGVCFGGGVIFTGFVPEADLGVLYNNAEVYVFPSLCEGFGLPPLEAMSYGLPVVASRATCLPEILGEAAHYFDATNLNDMAAKINEVVENNNLRQRLIEIGLEQIKKYSWQKMAEETLEIYRSVKS